MSANDPVAGSVGGSADSLTSSAGVRTILRMQVREGCGAQFEAAWAQAAVQISKAPGQVRQELMRDQRDPAWYWIVSDWADSASLEAFGRSSAREVLTEALRDLRTDAARTTFSVLAVVPGESAPAGTAPPETAPERTAPMTHVPVTDVPGTVRIDLSTAVAAGEEIAFEKAYLLVTQRVGGHAGLVREELLREAVDDGWRYHIFAEWSSEATFRAWVEDPAHMEDSGPLARWLSVDFARRTLDVRRRPTESTSTALGTVRVDLSTFVAEGESDAFESAYLLVTQRVGGHAGLVREELLREAADGGWRYHIFAEWSSERTFLEWVENPAHMEDSGPLARWLSVDFARQTYVVRARPSGGKAAEPVIGPVAEPVAGTELAAAPVAAPVAEPVTHAVPEPRAVPEVVTPPTSLTSPSLTSPSLTSSSLASPTVLPAARETEVLVVGAGPTGLTQAIELARRGVAVRVVDKRTAPSPTADKAIGIQCRTMEIWERLGVVGEAMDAGTWLHGQTVYVNGRLTHQMEWAGLTELPYAHLGLPQYETERILAAKLASLGVQVERGVELAGFTQDDAGVTSVLRRAGAPEGSAGSSPGSESTSNEQVVRSQYVVGADGAHSAVRSTLGLTFEGGLSIFPQLFMLADLQLDWDVPSGHLIRFVRIEDNGDFTGMLICVPLKGRNRYRLATLAPPRLQKTIGAGVVEAGFWQEYDPPSLADIQAVLDDLAPAGTTGSDMRWSSVFRIKHGIVDRYRVGRAFVAGDAAHLHPPAGGQGMNTGIQDAWNLGWKLALAVRGEASPGLLDSYEAERRPAGKAIVDRAVALAFTDEIDMEDEKEQFLLEMQMTMNYAGSALVGEHVADGARPQRQAGSSILDVPEPGYRAPDASGLRRFGVAHDVRVFDLLSSTRTVALLYADASAPEEDVLALEKVADALVTQGRGQVEVHVVVSPDATLPATFELPVHRDTAGAFRRTYGVSGTAAYVVRPDGHVGFRSLPVDLGALTEHLAGVLA